MQQQLKYIALIILVIVAFFAGAYWNQLQLLSDPLELKAQLILRGEIGEPGTLPKGTVLYPYSYKGEIATFIVFVNTKSLDLVQPIKLNTSATIAPLDGNNE